MKQNKETLKQFFETGDKPTQQQYYDLIDSYVDAKQPAGEPNRRFVIDETGEVSIASELAISQSDWNQTDSTQPDFIKNKPEAGLPVNFYEEGTFTPTLFDSSSGATYNMSTSTCKYTRIGNVVNFYISFLGIETSGTPTGALGISGIPYPWVAGLQNINILELANSNASSTDLNNSTIRIIAGNLYIYDFEKSKTLNAITFTSGQYMISGSYKTNVYTP
ncbi:hypothetical protein [Tenacibaculum sp.]|uniref:hypothetical protein n=1 Tax=Tenacibaculum sp. TaxID=1906242 RepID=UPI003D0C97D8